MNFYLCLDENNVIRDSIAVDYEIIDPKRIPWDKVDKTLIGRIWDGTAVDELDAFSQTLTRKDLEKETENYYKWLKMKDEVVRDLLEFLDSPGRKVRAPHVRDKEAIRFYR